MQRPHTGRARVLIVDDDPLVLSGMRRLLAADHDVTTANGGATALATLRSGARFDVIVCDLMMPELSGMDLHASVAELDADQAERMLFVTGNAYTEAAQSFLNRVPNARLFKPFDVERLRALIRSKLG